MLAVLFLGVIAGFELTEETSVLDYGLAIAAVVTGMGIATYLFAKVHQGRHEHERGEPLDVPEKAQNGQKEGEHG